MPLRIVFADRFGVNHPAAHGVVTKVEIDLTNQKGVVVLDLFDNLGAQVSGRDPFDTTVYTVEDQPAVTDIDEVVIVPADPHFQDFFADAVLAAAGASPLSRGEDFLVAKVPIFSAAARV